ncbi:hypothetical protein F5Y19DRAFT_478255 [Xylariaceae sp. FL1651]|nr:hypothetical protein F5Y19DRAFT_478255 [Xylariaceae sp. FL1651]
MLEKLSLLKTIGIVNANANTDTTVGQRYLKTITWLNWSGSRPDAIAALNAKFGTQRTNKSVDARTSKLKQRRFVPEKPWFKVEDDFLLRWPGLRQDDTAAVTAALNARFGTQRAKNSIRTKIPKLNHRDSQSTGQRLRTTSSVIVRALQQTPPLH